METLRVMLVAGALALAGCRGTTAPEDLSATAVIAPTTFRSGTDATVTVTVVNHGIRSRRIVAHACPEPFVVTTLDGRIVGPGHRICTASAVPPLVLDPGEAHVFTLKWSGDGRTNDPSANIMLPPGTYRLRAAVPAEGRLLRSHAVTFSITQ